jgi:hypothetical protein
MALDQGGNDSALMIVRGGLMIFKPVFLATALWHTSCCYTSRNVSLASYVGISRVFQGKGGKIYHL